MAENVKSGKYMADDSKIEEILEKYHSEKRMSPSVAGESNSPVTQPAVGGVQSGIVLSNSFDASNLQKVVDEIKVIEDGIKGIIASRTKKIVEEKVPVEKERPVKYNIAGRVMVSLGLKKQEMETYTDYKIVKKEVPKQIDDVVVADFRSMIDNYINGLKGLNDSLRKTVLDVDRIVRNLTDVSDAFTDQIHSDRKAYNAQIDHSRKLEKQLGELIPIHESMSPIHDRYAEVEKVRDHLEMELRDSQGMELKYKTNIDMGVKYQKALKSYRTLINDFKERGDLHVNMVDKFAEGASHMKIAVDNVSQICSGVARVTQSMITIVESIDDGNRVLGKYAALVGDQITASPGWEMEYNALKEAEVVYQKNNETRMEQLEDNREEFEKLLENIS